MNVILKTLQEKLKTPVDIEFACDDKDFYLLQCRPQNYDDFNVSDIIPDDIATEKILFSANKFVSNGKCADITNIVYVDPVKYSELQDEKIMKQVGRAVGKLNKILPRRQFILMGPGRWGSRGDIKLGVSVTYADINNTAMLIEIAKQKGNYIPDLSFGTHFFQDLAEASIRYLPLYPDDEGVIFNEDFFCNSINILPKILPEYSHLSEVIKVIDIPTNTNGLILKVLMSADLDKAVGMLANPSLLDFSLPKQPKDSVKRNEEWRWRMSVAKAIANQLVNKRFGVFAVYLFGGIAKKTAGPKSDIDLIIHISNKPRHLLEIKAWLDGWDKSLIEINEIRTGYRLNKFIDYHFVNDDEIEKKIGFASKINAISDSAIKLTL